MTSDLHVTVTVSRDDATGLPVDYLHERASFDNELEAADYRARVKRWIDARPLPEPLGPVVLFRKVDGVFDVDALEQILDVGRWPA